MSRKPKRGSGLLIIGVMLVALSFLSDMQSLLSVEKDTSVPAAALQGEQTKHSRPLQKPFLPKPPAFVYVLKTSGMGSQLLNFFAQALYFAEHEDRSMIADEATYRYRYNASMGLFTAYFTPQFPVIDTIEQQRDWIEPLFDASTKNRNNYTKWRTSEKPGRWRGNVKHNRTSPAPMTVTTLYAARSRILKSYNTSSLDFYRKMVHKACPHLHFNQQTRQRILALQESHGIPNFDTANGPSAAFHVRRGDKLHRESKKFLGQAYLQKLEQVASGITFQHCFVATDDYGAVAEIRQALEAQSYRTCRHLWTLTQPTEEGFFYDTQQHSDLSTLQFLAELEVMVKATYFVGTFNSNVGSLTTVLRGCDKNNRDRQSHPYARSYGVDGDTWYFR